MEILRKGWKGTLFVKDIKNKRITKPASCTEPPWAPFIPPKERQEVLRLIRQDCIDHLGYPLDECPKRKVCISKTCLGRPMPWFSEHAKPYLEMMKEKHQVEENKDLFISTDCRNCPFYKSCDKPCNQVLDYIDKNKSIEPPMKNYSEFIEKVHIEPVIIESSKIELKLKDLPWDCLTSFQETLVKEYFIDQRDYRSIAEKHGLYNQAHSKYRIYVALNKLSKFSAMRDCLKKNKNKMTEIQQKIMHKVYIENKTQRVTAKDLNVSNFVVSDELKKIKSRFKVKCHTFVKKINKKTVYFTLKVLK